MLARACQRIGKSRTEFFALDDDEQEFWLAVETLRQQQIDVLFSSVKEHPGFDLSAAIAIMTLARL